MAVEFSTLSARAEHYRELAADLRDRAASTQTPEARKALATVAEDYELLAQHTESLGSTWQKLQQQLDE